MIEPIKITPEWEKIYNNDVRLTRLRIEKKKVNRIKNKKARKARKINWK